MIEPIDEAILAAQADWHQSHVAYFHSDYPLREIFDHYVEWLENHPDWEITLNSLTDEESWYYDKDDEFELEALHIGLDMEVYIYTDYGVWSEHYHEDYNLIQITFVDVLFVMLEIE